MLLVVRSTKGAVGVLWPATPPWEDPMMMVRERFAGFGRGLKRWFRLSTRLQDDVRSSQVFIWLSHYNLRCQSVGDASSASETSNEAI